MTDTSGTQNTEAHSDVRQVPQGVAVYANDTYSALKGRAALKVEWDLSKAETRSSDALAADFTKMLGEKGLEATNTGDVDKAFAGDGVQGLEAEIVFPFLAHAPMEPLDAVFAKADDGIIDIYSGSQFPGMDHMTAAKIMGLDPAKVRLNTQLAGGSFGRRARLAPIEMAWVGKPLGEICEQIKDPERDGGKSLDEIVEHMAHDSLVGWGWNP